MTTGKGPLPIRRFRIENFRCLEDVSLELGPLTVLVGPNASGKSTILRALEALAAPVDGNGRWPPAFGSSQNEADSATFQGRGGAIRLSLEGTLDDTEYSYLVGYNTEQGMCEEHLETGAFVYDRPLGRGGTVASRPSGEPRQWHARSTSLLSEEARRVIPWTSNDGSPEMLPSLPFLNSLANLFESIKLYQLQPSNLRSRRAAAAMEPSWTPGHPMSATGVGLSEELSGLLLTSRSRLDNIEQYLREWFPDFVRLHVNGTDIVIERRDHGEVGQPAISDGFLLMLGYLVLALGRPGRRLLLLEEPENGVHPGLMQRVVKFLKSVAYAPNSPIQIVMTTHSPLLLNEIDPDAIRLVERNLDSGATGVRPFSSVHDLQRLLEFQGPGEIWVNMRVDQPDSGV